MLDVFFTVDVELWCDGWQELDAKFARSFDRYILGTTPTGQYGLPYQLAVLADHGLEGVFFVEPLFSTHFGAAPLDDIVGLIREARQEVQLHLHTEWVDEAATPLLDNVNGKRQHLRYFTRDEQTRLIAIGKDLLAHAGVDTVSAFRAGSFGFNLDTLAALASNGVFLDASYNATMMGRDSGLLPGVTVVEPVDWNGVVEYPMTVFQDGPRHLRHAQLTACSYAELEGLLWTALHERRQAFMILFHNFELLDTARNVADRVVVERFQRLCAFLDKNRDSFRTRGFDGLQAAPMARQPDPLVSPIWKTAGRMFEQLRRKATM
jgi:hypothetical protein